MSDGAASAESARGAELDEHNQQAPDNLRTLFGLVGLAIVLWLLYWAAIALVENDPAKRGQFGDMFGGINALFSAGAFAGLIYTVLLQRTELRLQREELAHTRAELRGQRIQLEVQNSVMRLQSFENTFFEMVKLHHEIVDALELPNEYGVVRSRRAFSGLYNLFGRVFRETQEENLLDAPLEHVQLAYAKFYDDPRVQIGHYFRNLYHIIRFVAESPIEDRGRYTSLVRAQLSPHEHLLLFYNCLSEYGTEKFKPLIEGFALLENMPTSKLLVPRFHVPLYERSAYGDMANLPGNDADLSLSGEVVRD